MHNYSPNWIFGLFDCRLVTLGAPDSRYDFQHLGGINLPGKHAEVLASEKAWTDRMLSKLINLEHDN